MKTIHSVLQIFFFFWKKKIKIKKIKYKLEEYFGNETIFQLDLGETIVR